MRRLRLSYRTIRIPILLCLSQLLWAEISVAQRPSETRPAGLFRQASHKAVPQQAAMPPDLGTLLRSGWVQIVRFEAPVGATVEIASNSGVVDLTVPGHVGLALGRDYRLRISNVPDKPGLVLYPTIRLIGYLHPPAHVDPLDYPIPLQFTGQDFDEAALGRLVRNVIYLEDPTSALPRAFPAGELPIVELPPDHDAIFRAADLGRPMIFIQLGNRVPLDGQFGDPASDPPVYVVPATVQNSGGQTDSAIQPAGWQTPLAAAAAIVPGSLGRASASACHPNQPVVRLPYKVHPRMPRDECLPDGGDQIPYAHFTGYDQLTGVSPSETAAQFSRPGERPRLVTSNQVCVYAPRFGLVRSSAALIATLHMDGPRNVDHRLRRAAVEGRVTADYKVQKDKVNSLRRRERLGSVAMNETLGGIDELRVIAAMVKEEGYDKVFGHIGPNHMGQSDDPRIAMSIEAAKAWNRDQFPAYTAITEGGGEVAGSMLTGEVQQIKQPYRKPGDLTLWKTVTPQNAQQGEIVEFAIYYRNVGQLPLENVSIIDSLTARLEYVADSSQTDRRAVFTASPNDAESHELRWDISDPLPGGEGGVVWFKAKVR
jgi:uncharacterized repeat protein (TIGR01451 family)